MACPKCGCKVTYEFDAYDDGQPSDMERCAHCWHVFYSDDALDEDDDFMYQEGEQALANTDKGSE